VKRQPAQVIFELALRAPPLIVVVSLLFVRHD
jgi:hypothetical protein